MEIYLAQMALSETGFGVTGSAARARRVKGPECAALASGTGGQGRREGLPLSSLRNRCSSMRPYTGLLQPSPSTLNADLLPHT